MNKKTRLLLSIIYSVIILLAAYLSFTFMNAKNVEVINAEKINSLFTDVYKVEFDKNPKEIIINGKMIKFSVIDGVLYVNDKVKDYFTIDYIYYTGNLLFLVKETAHGERYQVFDDNGEKVIINYHGLDEEISFINLRSENNQIVANVYCEKGLCQKMAFIYQNHELRLKYLK